MPDELPDALALDENPSTRILRRPLARLLRAVLPRAGVVLEVGSGNGEHVVYLAGRMPRLEWQPSDPDSTRRAIVERWITTTSADNVRPPLDLDVTRDVWPVDRVDAIFGCNLLHAAPAGATDGLMRGAARVLAAGAPLVLCGLFLCGGDSERVCAYDEKLRGHDPAWGIRRIDEVLACARGHGLRLEETRAMPLEHLALVLERGRSER